jgi:hypothetical protein
MLPSGWQVQYAVHVYKYANGRWDHVAADSSWRWATAGTATVDAYGRGSEDWNVGAGYWRFSVDQYLYYQGSLRSHVNEWANHFVSPLQSIRMSDAEVHNSVAGQSGYCYSA